MPQTDVLIIGCGVAGCAAAIELAKQDIPVTLVSAGMQTRDVGAARSQVGIAYQGIDDSPERLAQDIKKRGDGQCCPRAIEHLVSQAPSVIQDFLIEELGVDFKSDGSGEPSRSALPGHSSERSLTHPRNTRQAIIEALLKHIETLPQVTILPERSAVELLTLAHHSKKQADIYKKPACIGAYLLNHSSGDVETWLAKETILATGGCGELFLHSTSSPHARGDGLALAERAGARLIQLEYIHFHPFSLQLPYGDYYSIPEEVGDMKKEGACLRILNQGQELDTSFSTEKSLNLNRLSKKMYEVMLDSGVDHLQLDLSSFDGAELQERFPAFYERCNRLGVDPLSEPLPVAPTAHYACGGVAVDRCGQSSLARLRAVGQVSCSGVHGVDLLPGIPLLESLVWARSCAQDVARDVHKFVYYFPGVEDFNSGTEEVNQSLLKQDWATLKQTMWNYVGLVRDRRRLSRALDILMDLRRMNEAFDEQARLTPQVLGLRHGVRAAKLVVQQALSNRQTMGCHTN